MVAKMISRIEFKNEEDQELLKNIHCILVGMKNMNDPDYEKKTVVYMNKIRSIPEFPFPDKICAIGIREDNRKFVVAVFDHEPTNSTFEVKFDDNGKPYIELEDFHEEI